MMLNHHLPNRLMLPLVIIVATIPLILFFLVGSIPHNGDDGIFTGVAAAGDSSSSSWVLPDAQKASSLENYMDSPRTQNQQHQQQQQQQKQMTTQSKRSSSANKVRSTTTTKQQQHKHIPKNVTKIIGFADFGYKDIAYRWYQEMEQLGYNNHMVAAQDIIASDYFASKGMRYDLIYQSKHNRSLRSECDVVYERTANSNKKSQMYRRSLFGSRWHYVLKQLRQGYHVLLTDVDNIYTQYKPMSEMEDSQYDVFHAYAGTVPSFPLNLFRLLGFTLCGGMSWLRSTPSIISFAQEIVNQCGCENLHCTCYCDDQVVLNRFVYYHYVWDHHKPGEFPTIPSTLEEMDWHGYTGYCNLTGHRVKIWDRDVAYRAEFDETTCPNKTRNWIAMPTGLDRYKSWDIWKERCLGISSPVGGSAATAAAAAGK